MGGGGGGRGGGGGGGGRAYNYAAVDADDKVEPGLDGELEVRVAQDLKAEAMGLLRLLRPGLAVEAREVAV